MCRNRGDQALRHTLSMCGRYIFAVKKRAHSPRSLAWRTSRTTAHRHRDLQCHAPPVRHSPSPRQRRLSITQKTTYWCRVQVRDIPHHVTSSIETNRACCPDRRQCRKPQDKYAAEGKGGRCRRAMLIFECQGGGSAKVCAALRHAGTCLTLRDPHTQNGMGMHPATASAVDYLGKTHHPQNVEVQSLRV